MIKFHELKIGDRVIADFEGQQWQGMITKLNREDKEVCVETDVQEFWFSPNDLYPIPLSEEQLLKLAFIKQDNGDGSVKYIKGPFRILLARGDDFTNFEMWYREDHRKITEPISVHELQNHYYQMTKVELTHG